MNSFNLVFLIPWLFLMPPACWNVWLWVKYLYSCQWGAITSVQIFKEIQGSVVIPLVVLWLFIYCHQEVNVFTCPLSYHNVFQMDCPKKFHKHQRQTPFKQIGQAGSMQQQQQHNYVNANMQVSSSSSAKQLPHGTQAFSVPYLT